MEEQKRKVTTSAPRKAADSRAVTRRGEASVSAPVPQKRPPNPAPEQAASSGPSMAEETAQRPRPHIRQIAPQAPAPIEAEQTTQPFSRPPHLRRPAEQKAPESEPSGKTDHSRYNTSLNWRHVAEPGEEGEYKSPRFQGAVREYIPKEPNQKPRRDPSPVKHAGMGEIKEQTPTRRRERSKQNRRQNLEKLHRSNYRRSFRMVQKKKRPKSFYLAVVCATLAMYLLFFGSFAAFFAGNLFLRTIKSQGSVYYTVGTEDAAGYAYRELRYGTVFRNGVMMLNMNDIAVLCDLTTTGDRSQMRYYSRGELGHDVVFFLDSQTAIVNGTPVTLAAKTVREGEIVYVSADFFERFASGLEIVWNEEKSKLTVSRVVVSTSVLKGDVYAELTFGLDPNEAPPSIVFATLPLELRMRIEAHFQYGDNPPPASGEDPTEDPIL